MWRSAGLPEVRMNVDLVYSCVIDFACFLLGGWMTLLLAAYVVAFYRDPSRPEGPPQGN